MTEIVHYGNGSRQKQRAENDVAFLEPLHLSTISNYILRIKSSVFSLLSNYHLVLYAWRSRQQLLYPEHSEYIYMPIYVNSCAIFKG